MKKFQEMHRCLIALLAFSMAANALWAQAQESEASANSLYEQARKHAARGNLELAIATYEAFLQNSDIHKDAQERLQSLREQLEQRQRTDKLERKYASGMAALKARDWAQATLEFETLLQHAKTFRDADKRLNEARNRLAKESPEALAVRFYALGMAAMNWNELDEARVAFKEVLNLKSDFREARLRLQVLERTREQAAKGYGNILLADSLARVAELAATRNDWTEAAVALEALRVLEPNNHEVINRLATARTNLGIVQARPEAEENSAPTNLSSFHFGGLAALIMLPALGWLLLSPTVRARRLMLRHDYRAAAKVYEKLLERHPNRVKYFSKLADIYLLEGRKDDEAMKVYRNVLQLNLAVGNREKINATVAQQYLLEGRTDADAIEVLEKELALELHRKNLMAG